VNVRDAFHDVLRAHGISTIFGSPGSNELPLLSHLPSDFRYIHALQEGAAIGWRMVTRRLLDSRRW
jgi:benzoylformate decarboxylase